MQVEFENGNILTTDLPNTKCYISAKSLHDK
jgi:hypothetical protein